MATVFALNHLGAAFQVKLKDCFNDADVDISAVVDQMLVFYKPNGTKFLKQAILVVDPQNPSQAIPISNIVGDGFSSKVTVTIAATNVLKNGELVTISATSNFNVTNKPVTIVDATKFTYDLDAVGSSTPEASGTATTQGERLVQYINTTPETESILDSVGKWEYAGQIELSNNDKLDTQQRFVFWVE